MILANFHLNINLLLYPKFQLNWPCGLRENVQNRFSRWRLCHNFSLFQSRNHPVATEQVSTQIDQRFEK